MTAPRTLFDRIWEAHAIASRPDRGTLLRIDRHYVHEGSFHGFDRLRLSGRRVRRPDLTFAFADHYVPTRPGAIPDPEIARMVELLAENAAEQAIRHFGRGDPRQGIVHVVAPEQGLTLPGATIVCGDSHTSTHGALGALAFGIGASEVEHVLATQTLWQRRPRTLRIVVDGRLGAGVTAKDLILAIIGRIGASGGIGHVIEYAGSAVRALSVEARMTMCNMSIEAGARAGMVAPDETTVRWLAGRTYAPQGEVWDRAAAAWLGMASDADSRFDREVRLDGAAVEPTVTWGTSPETALPVSARVPEADGAASAEAKAGHARMLAYMGLAPGMALTDIRFDRVFIGSCTNARLEDLAAAAAVLDGRKAVVPTMIVPGSLPVRAAAEAQGLDLIFRAAGCDWRTESGCSMCVGTNGDLVPAGERCASTSNRNFEGRQGKGARTHLMSPAMAAAVAVTGRITDVRRLPARA